MLQGEITIFNSSGSAMRGFCAKCGTGITYRNAEYLPGIVDIQGATFDNPEHFAPGIHIQTAEQVGWMANAHELPKFERFPGP